MEARLKPAVRSIVLRSVPRVSRPNEAYDPTEVTNREVVGSGGLMVRTPACRSRGRWFDSTSAVSKLGQFRSPHFARVLSEEALKAVGPNSCVSSILGCLEYNYLRLEMLPGLVLYALVFACLAPTTFSSHDVILCVSHVSQ